MRGIRRWRFLPRFDWRARRRRLKWIMSRREHLYGCNCNGRASNNLEDSLCVRLRMRERNFILRGTYDRIRLASHWFIVVNTTARFCPENSFSEIEDWSCYRVLEAIEHFYVWQAKNAYYFWQKKKGSFVCVEGSLQNVGNLGKSTTDIESFVPLQLFCSVQNVISIFMTVLSGETKLRARFSRFRRTRNLHS